MFDTLEMSARLMYPLEPKEFCTSTRTDQHGFIVAECTLSPGHKPDHTDVHSGHTWKSSTPNLVVTASVGTEGCRWVS